MYRALTPTRHHILQWVYKGRRYILIKLNKPEDEM